MAKIESSDNLEVVGGSLKQLNLETAPVTSSHNEKIDLNDLGMAKIESSDNLEVVGGSLNLKQLNLETAPVASSHNEKIDLNDDDTDFWGEDEALNDDTDDGVAYSSALNREWKRRHDQFHTMGYRDGITRGKEAAAQEGFNVGFSQSVHHGYKWGLIRGTSSAYANLPEHLKEKLAATTENRDRFLNLYQNSHMISTTDALKIFHESIQYTETRTEHPERSSHLLCSTEEGSSCNQLDSLFKEFILLLHDSQEIDVKIGPSQETSV